MTLGIPQRPSTYGTVIGFLYSYSKFSVTSFIYFKLMYETVNARMSPVELVNLPFPHSHLLYVVC
jgi:hypothetical protein